MLGGENNSAAVGSGEVDNEFWALILQDREWLDRSVLSLTSERLRLGEALRAFDWLTPLPSHTNFVLCRVTGGRDARAVKQALERQGVLVRYFDKDGLRDCLRITVGKPEHTDALVAALKAIP
jgi:histidinol-phosphate aminotransferase